MIYRGVRMERQEEKRRDRRDLLKAAAIGVTALAVIAGVVFLTTQLGIR